MEQIARIAAGPLPDSGGTQSIGRAVALLRLVAASRSRGTALSDLVERSGLAKPTCRRILVALIEAGLVEQEPETRRYCLGPEAYVLGAAASDRFGIHRLAHEGVLRLAKDTGDAAFLQIRRDRSVVCLLREDGDYPIRSHVLAPSDRHPLGVGAGGLALLAAMTDSEVEAALDANNRLLAERYPVLTRPLLVDLVAETRERGYAMNRGLLFPGSWGMGVAVRDADGRPGACLSLACIESRMQGDREPELARLLTEEVRVLERKLEAFRAPNPSAPAPVRSRRLAGAGR
ncbi:MAG TPA: IclR family transcriptional regulator [Microvirga sp.]|jgi:DNA-binding IclR family transcriptional regulator|nr:IclR family transcriptional regulator [Microvirga sp.]